MMTANHTLFEKEGVFGFHVSTCHLEQLVAVAEDMFTLYSTDRSIAVHVHVVYVPRAIPVGRGFIITSLFGAYPLLGAYLLTTYTYKRIRLLTRVYGMFVEFSREKYLPAMDKGNTHPPTLCAPDKKLKNNGLGPYIDLGGVLGQERIRKSGLSKSDNGLCLHTCMRSMCY